MLRETNKLCYRVRGRPGSALEVSDADWDNLILLDACRCDVFAEQHDLPADFESLILGPTSTLELLERYTDGAILRDTSSVPANPQLRRHQEEFDVSFHDGLDI